MTNELGLMSDTLPEKVSLPRAFLKTIDAHPCRCQDCDPDYVTEVLQAAESRAEKQYKDGLEQEVVAQLKQEMIAKHLATIEADAQKEVELELVRKIQREELETYKGKLEEEIKQSWKDEMQKEIQGAIEQWERQCSSEWDRRSKCQSRSCKGRNGS